MVKLSNKSIGLLGGSFDPVHKGHLAISKIALKKIKLDQIYWVVTKKNPFKKTAFFSLEERLKLAKKTTKNGAAPYARLARTNLGVVDCQPSKTRLDLRVDIGVAGVESSRHRVAELYSSGTTSLN